MRKAIQKYIDRMRKYGLSSPEFEAWMSATTLTIPEVSDYFYYYYRCADAGYDRADIIKEIERYGRKECYPGLTLDHDFYPNASADVIFKDWDTKDQIIKMANENIRMASLYTDVLKIGYEIYKDSTKSTTWKNIESLISAKCEKQEDRYHLIHALDEYINCDKKYEKEKKEKERTGEEITNDRILKKILWQDFEEYGKDSFLYKLLNDDLSVNIECNTKKPYIEMTEKFGETFLKYCYRNGISNHKIVETYFKYYAEDDYNKFRYNEPNMSYILYDGKSVKNGFIGFDFLKAFSDVRNSTACGEIIKQMQKNGLCKEDGIKCELEYINDTDLLDKMLTACNNHDFIISLKSYKYEINLTNPTAINITIIEYQQLNIRFHGDDDYQIINDLERRRISLFITEDATIYYSNYTPILNPNYKPVRQNWYPLRLKELFAYTKIPITKSIIFTIADATGNNLLKDVYRDMLECPKYFYPPISYEDTVKYHTKKEYFLATYKKAPIIRWNYNKRNIFLSYLVIKALEKVAMTDYGILQNVPDKYLNAIWTKEDNESYYSYEGPKEIVNKFLAIFYKMKQPDCFFKAYDYVRMCHDSKTKVVLHYSVNRMIEEHDRFNESDDRSTYMKQVKTFKIPKDSKFNDLRKILPSEFEWIKRKTRLIDESIMQHHCVWSYYDKIANDKCAIYSYNDTKGQFDVTGKNIPRRYTMEFVYNSKTKNYHMTQLQTKYDRYGGTKLAKYIKDTYNIPCSPSCLYRGDVEEFDEQII